MKGIGLIVHCNMKFQPDEIRYLYDNTMFTHRKIEIGTCPKCSKQLVRLVEKRIVDGKVFDTTYKEKLAERTLKEYEDDIMYSTLDQAKQKKVLHGFRYGENYERTNKSTGEVTMTQKAVDFFGNKETVKKFKL